MPDRIENGIAILNGIRMGNSTVQIQTDIANYKFNEIRCKSIATSGDSRLAYCRYELSGAGAGGECIRAFTKVSAALTTARGIHISIDFGSAGSVSGLGAGIDAQIMLDNATYAGTKAVVNAEIYTNHASAVVGGTTSFIRFVNSGLAKTSVDDNAFLFELSGFSSGAAKLWYDHQGSAPANIEEWIKVKTDAGTRWIPLYNAVV